MNTLFVGNVVRHFTELESTNDFATELLAKSAPSEGTVIFADYQQAGRGQIGRSWFASPAKNLLCSFILRPTWLAARNQFSLSQAVALAVADTVSEYSPQVAHVKWPNDVYVGDRKIAGILIQNSLNGFQLQWSVIGIGLNVNEVDFPAALPNPTSLHLLNQQPQDRTAVLATLCTRLEQRYLQLKSKPAIIRADYLRHLYRYQEWHPYTETTSGQMFLAQIVGVHANGQLSLQLQDGSLRTFDLKAIAFDHQKQ